MVGGSKNTINNTFQTKQAVFNNAEIADAGLKKGLRNLLSLELIFKYIEPLAEEVDNALRIGRYPLKIRTTDLIIDCANGIYYNDGNRENEVEQLINDLFTLVCVPLGFNYKAQIAQRGFNFFSRCIRLIKLYCNLSREAVYRSGYVWNPACQSLMYARNNDIVNILGIGLLE